MKDTKYRFFFGVFVGFVLAGLFFFFFFKVAHAQTRHMSPQAHAAADGTYQQAYYEDKISEDGYGYAKASHDYLADQHYGERDAGYSYAGYKNDAYYGADYNYAKATYHVGEEYGMARGYYGANYMVDHTGYEYQANVYIG